MAVVSLRTHDAIFEQILASYDDAARDSCRYFPTNALMRFRMSSDRVPHNATTTLAHAYARAQLAEYAKIPPLNTLIRPHGAECDPPHDPQQHTMQEAYNVDLARVATLRPVVLGRLLVRRE